MIIRRWISVRTGIIILTHVNFVQAQPTTRPDPAAVVAERQREIDALAGKVDPSTDDWTTEILAQSADKRLKAFGHMLIEQRAGLTDGIDAFFAPGCVIKSWVPVCQSFYSFGNCKVFRNRRETDDPKIGAWKDLNLRSRISSLLESHRRAIDMRVKFKVVSVELVSDTEFKTDVLFQAFSNGPEGRVQQNADWAVTWTRADTDAKPLIKTIKQHRFEKIVCQKPVLVDCTLSVIADDAAWSPQLAHGCEYWYGRIDAVGEINYMGHNGIAVGDVNGDGMDDLYVAQGTGLPNKLFVQNADGTVRETAHDAGVAWLDDTKGVLLVDLDNDGDQDLLCAIGPTILYCRNDGDGRFTPHRALRASSPASFYSLAAADYDADGDLDIYACRYVKRRYGTSVPVPFHDANNGPANHLLRNDGEKGFTDVTGEVGLHVNNGRFSLAATWIDYDNDGDPDLYVANDFGRNNLFRNDHSKFVDVSAEAGAEDQAAGMGASWADFDLDGDFDLCVSNMFSSAGRRIAYQSRFMQNAEKDARLGARRHSLGNTLLVNQGDGTFRDETEPAGVRMGRWAWGSKFIDFNNDGFDDLIVPNGFLTNEHKDDL